MRRILRQTAIPCLALCGLAESLLFFLQKFHFIDCWNCPVPSGSFRNPGPFGGFTACCLIALLGLAKLPSSKWRRTVLYSMSVILMAALVLSCSRAACVAAIVGCIALYSGGHCNHRKAIAVIAASLLLCGLMYFIRPASANGRLLVWRVCLDMVADKPLAGHGLFAMRRGYMPYQADYFSGHPDSVFSRFADNTVYCFNEPLHICVCFGVIGLLAACLLVIPPLASKSKDAGDIVIKSIMWTWLAFSLFSYPLSVFRLSAIVLICLLTADSSIDGNRRLRLSYDCFLSILLFSLLLWHICGAVIQKRIVNSNGTAGFNTELLKFFPEQYDLFVNMNHANASGDCDSLVLSACDFIPSYGLCLKAGDVCLEHGDDSLALHHYRSASRMIPSRLLPHYKLFLYYWGEGDMGTASSIGEQILRMPVKTGSSLTFQIRGDVKRKIIIKEDI